MKFKVVFTILILLIIGAFSYAIYLSIELERTNSELQASNELIDEANSKLTSMEAKAKQDLEECLKEGNLDKWDIASKTNTLEAYSSFVDNCNSEESDCQEDDLEKAIEALLNAKGYVQMIETNGNRLYTEVDLSIEGEFVKFKTDKSVRNGAIGIPNCGSSSAAKTGGIVLKDKTVKVLDKCEASGSSSVWGHIQFTD